jgi:hypothetical protein
MAPARAPPAVPGQHGVPGAAVPPRPAPRAPQAAAAAGGAAGGFQAAAGLSGLNLADMQAWAGSSAHCAAATKGNVGAAPRGSGFGGQQVTVVKACNSAQRSRTPLAVLRLISLRTGLSGRKSF